MRLVYVLSVLLLAACAPAVERQARERISPLLNDPGSAQYQKVARCPGTEEIITGEVNAKNAFGGYVGFARFYIDRGVVTIGNEAQLRTVAGEEFFEELVQRCAHGRSKSEG